MSKPGMPRRWLKDRIDEGAPLPSFVRQRWGTVAALATLSLIRPGEDLPEASNA